MTRSNCCCCCCCCDVAAKVARAPHEKEEEEEEEKELPCSLSIRDDTRRRFMMSVDIVKYCVKVGGKKKRKEEDKRKEGRKEGTQVRMDTDPYTHIDTHT